jgi:hypothetical protein
MSARAAIGPLTFAWMVGAFATLIWMLATWGAPILKTGDPEVRLCDQAVEALLHSKDLVEVTRAGIIIRTVNCGIGKRLP